MTEVQAVILSMAAGLFGGFALGFLFSEALYPQQFKYLQEENVVCHKRINNLINENDNLHKLLKEKVK